MKEESVMRRRRALSWLLAAAMVLSLFAVSPLTAYAVLTDTDGDGIPDASDNAPHTYNPDQADADSDGIGDVADNAPYVANPDQADADSDGVGDVADNAPYVANPDQADADNDGVGDVADNAPNIANADQKDSDGDGIGDVADPTPNGEYDNNYNIEAGSVTITANGNYRIYGTGTQTSNTITVNSGITADITLDHINISAGSSNAVDIGANADIALILKENTVNSISISSIGIAVRSAADVELKGSGTLNIAGCAVGIGSNNFAGGNLTLNQTNLNMSVTGQYTCGIGTMGVSGTFGSVTIDTSTVSITAASGSYNGHSGILGVGSLSITDSNVTVQGNEWGAINTAVNGSVSISDSTVSVQDFAGNWQWGAGITAGAGGDIIINNTALTSTVHYNSPAYTSEYANLLTSGGGDIIISGTSAVTAIGGMVHTSNAGYLKLDGGSITCSRGFIATDITTSEGLADSEGGTIKLYAGQTSFSITKTVNGEDRGGNPSYKNGIVTGKFILDLNGNDPGTVNPVMTTGVSPSGDFAISGDTYISSKSSDASCSYWRLTPVLCKIGESQYTSLFEALLDVTNGQTITLLDDIAYSGGIAASSKSFVIDLDGYTLGVSSAADHGISATNGSTIAITGGGALNVALATPGTYAGLYAAGPGSAVTVAPTVDADITASGAADYGMIADVGGHVTMTGSVTAGNGGSNLGVYVSGPGSLAEITGPVSGGWVTVYATGGGAVSVTGDVTCAVVNGYGVYESGSSVTVTGDVSATGGGNYGVYANDGTVLVTGNVTSGSLGADARGGGNITIDGTISAALNYIRVFGIYMEEDSYAVTTTKENYRTYAVTYEGVTQTIWVKIKHPVPYATNVGISGDAVAGSVLTGDYDFNADDSGDAESGTTFRWLRDAGTEGNVFSNENIGGVSNGGTSPSFTLAAPTLIAFVQTYHWNNGSGTVTTGTISLTDGDGHTYGPWQTEGLVGSGAPNAYWRAAVYDVLPAGTYTVVDSEPATWAQNEESSGLGHTLVRTKTYGGSYTPISGALDLNYTLKTDDVGCMIRFEPTVTDDHSNVGDPVLSSAVGPVKPLVYKNWTDGITAADQYPFGGGSGSSAAEAYEISTPEQLSQLAYNVNAGNNYSGKYFKLTAHLNLLGKDWTPIGYRFYPDYERGFNGTFDGNGYSISKLSIGSEDEPKAGGDQTQAGLFGATSYDAVLKNIRVEAAIYTDSVTNVGALVGYSESNEVILDCSATGSVVSTGSGDLRIGGLIGDSTGASILNCSSHVNVIASGGTAVGGVIGYPGSYSASEPREINGCVFTGSVSAGDVSSYGGVGGIAGESYGYIIFINCANKGTVSGSNGNIGGIVGRQHCDVANCYSSGAVSVSGGYLPTCVGGITGYIDSGSVYNCYDSGIVSTSGSALVGALVGYGCSYTTVSNGYFDRDINPDITHVGSTGGNKYYLHKFTTEEMKGAAPESSVEYASGVYASGAGAFEAALNGWIAVQTTYSDLQFAQWDTLGSLINNGYPFLVGVEYTETDATLSALSASGITLSPAFSSGVTSYSADAANGTGTTTVTAEPSNSEAAVTINGTEGTAKEITLNVGSNTITVQVTAADGITEKTYTIDINRASGGSSGGGSVTGTAIQVTTTSSGSSVINRTELKPAVASGTASAKITAPIVDALLGKARSSGGTGRKDVLEVALGTTDDLDALKVTIAQSELERIVSETDASLAVTSPALSVTFDAKALGTISGAASGGTVVISAGFADLSKLSEKEKKAVGGRPVYDFTVTNGETKVSDFAGGHATVSIPYTLGPGEDPNCVVIYYLADDGSLVAVRGSYDPSEKAVVFKTGHFSGFVIGYREVSFGDVPAGAWYERAVNFIAARGMTNGTAENTFSPEANLTRGQFVVLLMRAYGISPDKRGDGAAVQFDDAGDTYYTDYLLAARSLGIIAGTGGNLFAPERAITRQEMCVMLYNALKVLDEVPEETTGKTLADFSDASSAASWAQEALNALIGGGVVKGSGTKIAPAAATTRAEIAQVLYNLLSE